MKPFSHIEDTDHIWKERNQYIAHAMPLDIMSSGIDPENAKLAVDEAVSVFINTASSQGTLEEILSETGNQCIDEEWFSPSWVSVENVNWQCLIIFLITPRY